MCGEARKVGIALYFDEKKSQLKSTIYLMLKNEQ